MKKLSITKNKASFIAVMGVNNISKLRDDLELLKGRDTKNIQVCFGMDYKNKEQVELLELRLKKLLKVLD